MQEVITLYHLVMVWQQKQREKRPNHQATKAPCGRDPGSPRSHGTGRQGITTHISSLRSKQRQRRNASQLFLPQKTVTFFWNIKHLRKKTSHHAEKLHEVKKHVFAEKAVRQKKYMFAVEKAAACCIVPAFLIKQRKRNNLFCHTRLLVFF